MIALDFGQSEKVDLTPIYNSLTYHQYEIDLLNSKPPKNVSFDLGYPESRIMAGYHFCNKDMYGDYKTDVLTPFPDFGKPFVWNHHGVGVYISQLHQGFYYDIFEFCAGAIEAGAMNMGVNNYFQIKVVKDVHSSFSGDKIFTFITYPSMRRVNEGRVNACEQFTWAYAYPHGGYTTKYTVSNTFAYDEIYTQTTTYSFSMGGVSDFSSMLMPNYTKCSYYYFTTETHFTPGTPG